MTHRINEFFFLTEPEMMLATHIPKNEAWQLLPDDKAHTIKQFEEVNILISGGEDIVSRLIPYALPRFSSTKHTIICIVGYLLLKP